MFVIDARPDAVRVADRARVVLVAAGIAKSESDVKFVFEFPAIWDLTVWVLPNPSGAFADKNPNVKPVNPPKSGMEM